MVINSDIKVAYRGDGQTKVFPFSFPYFDKNYICVRILDEVTGDSRTLDSDYYVDETANAVHYPGYPPGQEPPQSEQPPVLPETSTITIYRSSEISQLIELGQKYPLPVIESALDKITHILQEHDENIKRSIKVDITSTDDPQSYFDEIIETAKLGLQKATEAIEAAASAESSATAAGISATNAATSAEQALISQNAASASQTAAATSASNAAVSENIASAAATSAAASETAAKSSQQAAALSAGAAADRAAAAANSAATTAGVISAAQTAQTAAAASASMAITNAELAAQAATTATTKAGQANTSAQAAQAAAAQAAVSASSATTSAQGAANSATAAAGSASDAADSATAAAASAAAAADSATAASTSYEQAAAAVVDVLDIVAEAAVTYPAQSGTLTYTGSSQSPTWDSYYQPNKVTVSGTQSATNAGTYTVTFTLKSGYYWLSDNTTAAKTQTWTIGRQAIDTVPSQRGVLVYDGTTKTASFSNYDSTKLTKGGTYSAVNAGIYTATFTPKANYKWYDGTTTAKSVQWTISAASVTVPTVTNTSKTYTGLAQGPTISSYDSSLIDITGATATNAGSYTLIMHLKNNSLLWSDGTTADKTYSWSISPATVTAPTVNNTSLIYSGAAQGPTISSYDTTAIVQSGTASAIVVGSYSVTFSLASEGNYIWSDSTTASKTFSWSISAASVTMPTLSNTSKTYDGTSQGPIISAYDANVVEVSGDVTATDVGTHTVTFHLIDSSNYTWSDSSITDKSATWTMVPKAISAPSVTDTSKTYSGSSQGPTIGSFSSTEITQGGTASATNAGSYSVTFSLASNNYIWSDETTVDKSVSWTIDPKTVTVPTVTGTSKTYSGSSQGPTIGSFSTTEITQGGTATATNAGSYSITFTLTSTTNYKWSDNTTAQKSVAWTIAKATGSLSISKNSVSLTSSALTDTVAVTRTGDGTISAISGDTSIATTSISGTTITITAVGNGTTSITVSVAEGTNYLAPTALSITVSVQLYKYMKLKIDQNDSDPETSCTYLEDAVDMTPGSDEWDEFFGCYPCMLKNGVEVGRLKRDDFTKYEDGSPADITSGAEGDVMIAFPLRGIRYTKSTTKIINIYITDDPQASDYTYLAFNRNDVIKDKIYIGAYQGSVLSNALRSLSNATCDTGKTLDQYRTYARANGESSELGVSGYEQMNIYQLGYLQILYLFKYKNRDSQSAVGKGFVTSNSAKTKTGGTETKGMDWGETTGKQHMKLFGIEDLWGNVNTRIDGVEIRYDTSMANPKSYYYTFYKKYDKMGDYLSYTTPKNPYETTSISLIYQSSFSYYKDFGFWLNNSTAGSATTQWCDQGRVTVATSSSTIKLMVHGGYYKDDTKAGMFMMDYNYNPSDTSSYAGARLTYI